VSLSHHGVLFLDEFPEFGHAALESLRQPMEDRQVTVSRAQGSVTFPASFMLVAAMNPCPCGYYGDPVRECKCAAGEISRYHRRISGPLLDRIDIFVDVPRVEYEKLVDERPSETSEAARARVEEARATQERRFRGIGVACNAEMTPREVKEFCSLEGQVADLLRAAMKQFHLSGRAFHRVLKLSRSIADLENSDAITSAHVAEALQYRHREII